jgi:hypothetical protein
MRHSEIIPSTKNILFGKPVIEVTGRKELGKLTATRSSSENNIASTMFSRSLILAYLQDISYVLNTARAAILITIKNRTTSVIRLK